MQNFKGEFYWELKITFSGVGCSVDVKKKKKKKKESECPLPRVLLFALICQFKSQSEFESQQLKWKK